jgi:succinate-semialdehyde dehydrogenase/glutarate-semialdehyde dehydrogenase
LQAAEQRRDDACIESHDPATGELVGKAEVTSPSEVKASVVRARAAQASWGAMRVEDRVRAMVGVKRLLVERAEALADLEVREQGKHRFEAFGAVLNQIHLLGHLCAIAPRVLAQRRVFPLFGLTRVHRVVREPVGVVGVIAPWNFPFTLSMEPILAALIAGNAVVLKPSEHTSQVGLAIGALFRDALGASLVEVVIGAGPTGAALIEAGIDKLVFTGSVRNGRKVAALAGEHLVPLTLELGGKDAAIVLEDADLDRAAAGIAWGANLNAGQACLSIERVQVVEAVADRFLDQLAANVRSLRVGPGTDASVDVCAITTEPQLQLIRAHIADAVARGARIVCGGEAIERSGGRFFQPTVLADVTDDMRVVSEETFGPVIAVQRVKDAEEALARANASPYGLTASIWTRDLKRGRELASRIRAGDVSINEHAAPAGLAEIPWGGTKESGYGKTRGVEGLLEMCATKHVSWPRFRTKREMYWFPYSEEKLAKLRLALALLYGTWRDRLRALFRGGPKR